MDDELTKPHIGEKIREARLKRNLSQAKLAKIAGVSVSTIQRIERADRDTTPNNLAAVLKALDGYEVAIKDGLWCIVIALCSQKDARRVFAKLNNITEWTDDNLEILAGRLNDETD